jgi:hypothetical protein
MYSFGPYDHLTRTKLLPDLRKFLVGNRLQHPLLYFEQADPGFSARLNRLFEYRSHAANRTSDASNEWERLRPDLSSLDRLKWYLTAIFDRSLSTDYRIAGQVWTDPELISNTCDILITILDAPLPPFPHTSFMVDEECEQLAELPHEIQVLRGHVPVLEQRSSWTLDPLVALDWACRRVTEGAMLNADSYTDMERQFFMPVVTIGTVKRSQVFAFVSRRGESEILVNPEYVTDRKTFEVIYTPDELTDVLDLN